MQINCDFQPGTGLGGSSALTVALLKALSIFDTDLASDEIYKFAYDVERNDGILGGWQISFQLHMEVYAIRYKKDGVFVQQLR